MFYVSYVWGRISDQKISKISTALISLHIKISRFSDEIYQQIVTFYPKRPFSD